MGLINGSATYKRFQITDQLPKGFHERLVSGLLRYAFREIDPKTNSEQSVGWVNAVDPFDTDLSLDKILVADWIMLGIRWDRKSVPALLLKSKIAEKIRLTLAERRMRKLSREEIAQIRQAVKDSLLATLAPSTAVFEVLWNIRSNSVYLSTHASRVADYFVDLFEETTGLAIVEETLVSRVEDFCERQGMDFELESVDETSFVSSRPK
ncbi:MAG: recombination-associated protein RdgC [Candidatus Sumerlaeaceae bacterium]|nr:recombination-associated protein RdgC [Candidatus Sumerlaeaceae bacterium]